MRASSAVLTDTSVRLWDLVFPSSRALLARTRAAYIHLDNLIAHSKRDRDGRVDAYFTCYRPDETVVLFFLGGELANATVFTAAGRFAIALSEAMRHLRAEPERAEVAFHVAPQDQLATMYASCTQQPAELGMDTSTPEGVFRTVLEKKFTGVLEMISRARVSYLRVNEGRYVAGQFADKDRDEPPMKYVASLFLAQPPEPRPKVAVKAFPLLDRLPLQAPPAMVQVFRQFVWDLTDAAEKEFPGDAGKRSERVRNRLVAEHGVLRNVGGPRGSEASDPIVEPGQLAAGVAAWAGGFLGELEVVQPKVAPKLLKTSAREHRYALAAVGFFDRLPWRVEW